MAQVKLQYTSNDLGNILVYDDDTVKNAADGTEVPDAVVTHYIDENGTDNIRVDITGSGTIDVNPVPELIMVKVVKVDYGYLILLENYKQDADISKLSMAIYSEPGGEGYATSTPAFTWMEEYELYGTTCPTESTPKEGDPLYLGMMYDSTPYSTFVMQPQWQEQHFTCGGGNVVMGAWAND